tara:strand:- start:94 stop:1008 length:915 start_codon:yes stop_codon:yes gene_type:complete
MTPSIGIAFYLAIKSANLNKGDEIIIPDFSNTNFLNQVINLGLKPIIAGINNDLVINLDSLKKLVKKKTKAIFCTNIHGNFPNYKEIKKIFKDKKILIFEDASDALGNKFQNIIAGKFGELSFHDFSKDKTITCGEGGALLTDNKSIYLKAKKIRDFYNSELNQHYSLLCFAPSNLQGAMIYGQFKRLNNLKIKNRYIFNEYNNNLKNLDLKVFGSRKIIMEIKKRNKLKVSALINFLEKYKIYCERIQKPFSFKKFFRKNKEFLYSNNIYNNMIILPSHYNLNSSDILFICEKIKLFLKKNNY